VFQRDPHEASTSRPDAVAVTRIWSGVPEAAAKACAIARAAGKAPSIEAASKGQESISTTSCARACMNPVVGRPCACVKRRAAATRAMRIGGPKPRL
jgi:hypothetical protein